MKRIIALVISVLLGVGAGVLAISSASERDSNIKVNESGQTYGTFPNDPYGKTPELIAAVGIDGTEGYVYEKEMHRGPLAELGDSEYSRQVKILRKEAKEKGVNYLGLIPLYASDGKTVIGEFGWGSTFSFSVRLISDENGDMVYIDGDGNVLDIDAEGNPLIIGPDGKPMAVPVSDEHKQRKK